MKYSAIVALLLVASATSFAPASNSGRTSTSLAATKKAESAKKKSLFSQIADMDLFAPNPDVNTYGARSKKNMKVGKITSNSYVPAGLTKAQYEKIRSEEKAKKEARYKEKMAKAGIFEDFTNWYKKRGTDVDDSWVKSVTRGHTMVKTKYDWSGGKDTPLWAKVANKK